MRKLAAATAATAVIAAVPGIAGAAADPDGRYKGRTDGGSVVKHRVVNDGRLMKGFNTVVTGVCVRGFPLMITVEPVVVFIPKARIRASGKINKTYAPDPSTELTITGKRIGRRITNGHVEGYTNSCSVGFDFRTRHV